MSYDLTVAVVVVAVVLKGHQIIGELRREEENERITKIIERSPDHW